MSGLDEKRLNEEANPDAEEEAVDGEGEAGDDSDDDDDDDSTDEANEDESDASQK